jgi:hypothetical protein
MKIRSYRAIVTKYIGPSNTKGSRIKATAAAGSVTISYDDSLNSENAHAKAAEALANKFGWPGHWHMGGLPDDRGYCFVSTDENSEPVFVTKGQ